MWIGYHLFHRVIGNHRPIDIRIARLRRKVEADPEHPQAIRTVRGTGYMYVPARNRS